jgi:Uma2 family endonuclease
MPTPTPHATTAEELWNLPEHGGHSELIEGRLRVMEPGNPEHGRITSTANWLLSDYVRTTGSGVTYGAETGFVLAEDTVRAPDAAYIANERAEAVGRTERFWPGAPDFAIEVVSPSDRPRAVASKARSWLDAGARAVLVLDPRSRSATVYRAGDDAQTHTDGILDLSDAVPGWQVALADFFA